MAIIINLDSTLETASVSIAKDGIILQQKSNTVQKEHAAFLHSSIKSMLVQLNISIKNIDAIATTIGPGSYTGLRVCLAAAKGLCYALNKPLITIGTLEAMAKTAVLNITSSGEFLFCPMIDARGWKFTQHYIKEI
ncbi:MAG: tRNA (adenosine(37)-N6)-threonylcarbamoyltransferase complex dimerization subunit type 1 TsaB [Ferruginibacter sp.]|nr:tRNA (adenosine(37)-N6)-threonylcarbamoyltransferase complex dimerization subunit type 1 TsaB [Ferruginibacter sp.]